MKPDQAAELSAARKFAFNACCTTRLIPAVAARITGIANFNISRFRRSLNRSWIFGVSTEAIGRATLALPLTPSAARDVMTSHGAGDRQYDLANHAGAQR